MKICIIGTGYVGLVTGTCLSDFGLEVICIDKDMGKIFILLEEAATITDEMNRKFEEALKLIPS